MCCFVFFLFFPTLYIYSFLDTFFSAYQNSSGAQPQPGYNAQPAYAQPAYNAGPAYDPYNAQPASAPPYGSPAYAPPTYDAYSQPSNGPAPGYDANGLPIGAAYGAQPAPVYNAPPPNVHVISTDPYGNPIAAPAATVIVAGSGTPCTCLGSCGAIYHDGSCTCIANQGCRFPNATFPASSDNGCCSCCGACCACCALCCVASAVGGGGGRSYRSHHHHRSTFRSRPIHVHTHRSPSRPARGPSRGPSRSGGGRRR